MQDTGVKRLCATIVLRAVNDYKLWQKKLLQGKRPTDIVETNGKRAESFFKSDWFQKITLVDYEVDPEKLMKRIQEEAQHELRERKKKESVRKN